MGKLHVAFCNARAARYAVMNWHYSRRMPIGALVKIGVWENDQFIGAVIFGRGASPKLGRRWGLGPAENCELVRVALTKHHAPVSQILAQSVRLLKKHCPGLRLIVSFADPAAGHHGGVYQASNWIYTGTTGSSTETFHEGRWKHQREISGGAFGQPAKLTRAEVKRLPTRQKPGKHRYLLPLDANIRKSIRLSSKPYPMRQPTKRDSGFQPEEGGAEPTLALSST